MEFRIISLGCHANEVTLHGDWDSYQPHVLQCYIKGQKIIWKVCVDPGEPGRKYYYYTVNGKPWHGISLPFEAVRGRPHFYFDYSPRNRDGDETNKKGLEMSKAVSPPSQRFDLERQLKVGKGLEMDEVFSPQPQRPAAKSCLIAREQINGAWF